MEQDFSPPGAVEFPPASRREGSCLRVLAAGLVFWFAGCSPDSPPPPPAASDPLADAAKAVNEQDWDRAVALLDGLLQARPGLRPALSLYVGASQQKATKMAGAGRWELFHKSAEAARRLRDTQPPLGAQEGLLLIQALYNDACAMALAGRTDAAIRALAESVDAGLDSPSLLDNDPDLDAIRHRPDFAPLRHDATLRGAERRLARNHTFPFTFRLVDGRGKPVASDDFRGRVVAVNFWASWSPPCRRQAPFLAEIDRKYRSKGLQVVGLRDERDENRSDAFLAEFPSPYPQLRANDGTRKQLPRWDGYPTTLLIDRRGRVRLVVEGFGPADAPLIERAVTILLDET